MKYRFGQPIAVDGFDAVIDSTKDLHKLTRSTVPLLAWWPRYAERWWQAHTERRAISGADSHEPTAQFEYPVPASCDACPERGRGKASFTDVMLFGAGRAIALEAKYTEPRYDDVATWREQGSDEVNRKRVLAHWCHLIELHTGIPIRGELDGIVYQMVHRTASACAAAKLEGGRAEVAYLVFDGGSANITGYADDLRRAANILDPGRRLTFSLIRVGTKPGAHYERVEKRCRLFSSRDDRAGVIADALRTEAQQLYAFDDFQPPYIVSPF
jgi:hypothetical protein